VSQDKLVSGPGKDFITLAGERFPVERQLQPRGSLYGHQAVVRLDERHTLSIIWGACTYSSNYDGSGPGGEFCHEPTSVEIAVMTKDGLLSWADGDTVQGYVAPSSVAAFIKWWSDRPARSRPLALARRSERP
jgi:hypothetical protein